MGARMRFLLTLPCSLRCKWLCVPIMPGTSAYPLGSFTLSGTQRGVAWSAHSAAELKSQHMSGFSFYMDE
jgi:hypothetical protein